MGYLGWTSDLAGYLAVYSGILIAIGLVAVRYWIRRRGSWWIKPALVLLPVGGGTLVLHLVYRAVFDGEIAGVQPYVAGQPTEPAAAVLSWAGVLVGSWPLATLVSLILPVGMLIGRRAVAVVGFSVRRVL